MKKNNFEKIKTFTSNLYYSLYKDKNINKNKQKLILLESKISANSLIFNYNKNKKN